MAAEVELETSVSVEIQFELPQKVLVSFVSEEAHLFLQLDSPEAYLLGQLSEDIRTGVEATPLRPAPGLPCVACSPQDQVRV